MTTPDEQSVGWDAERSRLRLTRRQLAGLAAMAEGAPVDDDVMAALRQGHMLDDGGRLVGGAALAAVASVSFNLRLRLWRIPWGEPGRHLELVAGPDGVVAFVPDDPGEPEGVGEVVAQPPHRAAVTLWRMLRLEPRRDPQRSEVEVAVAELREGVELRDSSLARRLGVDAEELTLLRVDAVGRGGDDAEVASLLVIDAGSRGLWEGRGGAAAVTLTPRSSEAVFAGLARLQLKARAEASA